MLRTALVALLVGAVLTACGIRIVKYEFADDHAVAQAFTSVRVRVGEGDVTIRSQEGLAETKIHRRVEHTKGNKPSGVFHRVEGNALVLDDCGNDCDINYDVVVPSANITVLADTGSGDATIEGLAAVEYKTSSGSIRLRDIAGEVKISAGSGDLDATNVKGDFTADVGSGRVRLDSLKGKVLVTTRSGDITGVALDADVTADAGSGNVILTFDSPRSARVDTGSGDITVRVPGGPYRVSGDTNSGERRIDVPTSPEAQHELKLGTGSGNVRVLAV